jgi:hypothetical protein
LLFLGAISLSWGAVKKEYTVKSGDTLGNIIWTLRAQGIDVKQLGAWNPDLGTRLATGQKIAYYEPDVPVRVPQISKAEVEQAISNAVNEILRRQEQKTNRENESQTAKFLFFTFIAALAVLAIASGYWLRRRANRRRTAITDGLPAADPIQNHRTLELNEPRQTIAAASAIENPAAIIALMQSAVPFQTCEPVPPSVEEPEHTQTVGTESEAMETVLTAEPVQTTETFSVDASIQTRTIESVAGEQAPIVEPEQTAGTPRAGGPVSPRVFTLSVFRRVVNGRPVDPTATELLLYDHFPLDIFVLLLDFEGQSVLVPATAVRQENSETIQIRFSGDPMLAAKKRMKSAAESWLRRHGNRDDWEPLNVAIFNGPDHPGCVNQTIQ